MSTEQLIKVFDTKRDPYMEWHDGPSIHEVDTAMEFLEPGEHAAASRIVAERIGKGYDPYLGRAAELLGTPECRKALDEALASRPGASSTGNIARTILTMGKSNDAVTALKSIVENRSLGWWDRIDALVNLKIALASASSNRPISDFITPDFEAAIFEAIADDEYLVRYHAAEALLKAAGETKELSDHKELFALICGKPNGRNVPDAAEREGFRKASEIIRGLLKQ